MESRNRIIEGAAELFRTYGIKSVTMDSLANHLGISKRTIYELFSDKEGIYKKGHGGFRKLDGGNI